MIPLWILSAVSWVEFGEGPALTRISHLGIGAQGGLASAASSASLGEVDAYPPGKVVPQGLKLAIPVTDLCTDIAVLAHSLAQGFCWRRGKGSHPKGR